VWALILAELAPDRAVPLLKRGQAYAESRVLCNMHWPSDTVEGRFVGAYAYSRLQASPGFRADLQVARQELAAVRARKLLPAEDCQAEARALETRVPLSDSPGSRQ